MHGGRALVIAALTSLEDSVHAPLTKNVVLVRGGWKQLSPVVVCCLQWGAGFSSLATRHRSEKTKKIIAIPGIHYSGRHTNKERCQRTKGKQTKNGAGVYKTHMSHSRCVNTSVCKRDTQQHQKVAELWPSSACIRSRGNQKAMEQAPLHTKPHTHTKQSPTSKRKGDTLEVSPAVENPSEQEAPSN